MRNFELCSARGMTLVPTLLLCLVSCKGKDNTQADTSPASATAVTGTADANAPLMLRGTVVTVTPTELTVKTDTGTATVELEPPFHVYMRAPSDLSQVKESSFIGVTTVKQPEGSERATEIHVFPNDLRGVGEGTQMMTPDTNSAASRMTNGNVSAPRMTNGTASTSRMSNGNVSSANGSTLVVQYAGGSQTVTVPANTPVTEFKLSTRPLAAGDQVLVLVTKTANGSHTSSRALYTDK